MGDKTRLEDMIAFLSRESPNLTTIVNEQVLSKWPKAKKGKLSGDRVLDFILNTGILYQEVENKLRALDQARGSHVLIVKEKKSGRSLLNGYREDFELGILNGGIEFKKTNTGGNMLILPFDKRASSYDMKNWKIKEGPIEIHAWELTNLNRDISGIKFYNGKDEKSLGIYIGAEVEKYFDREGILTYHRALRLLGQETPSDLKGKFEDGLRRKSLEIFNNLEGLTANELKLRNSISSNYGAVGRHPFIESKTDAWIASIESINELEDIVARIRQYLGEALRLGLHQRDLTIEGNKPGIMVNVPLYISKMCETYKVEIPK